MLSHGNLVSNILNTLQILQPHKGERCLSVLPLSHIYERMAGSYIMLYCGVTIFYSPEPHDHRPGSHGHPAGRSSWRSPGIFERVYSRVRDTAMAGGLVKRAVLGWAMSVGHRLAHCHFRGEQPGFGLARPGLRRRPPRLRQGAGPHRGPDPAGHFRRRRPQPQGERVLLVPRRPGPRRLWPHGNQPPAHPQRPGEDPPRHRRAPHPRRVGWQALHEAGGRRGDPGARPERDAGLLEERIGHPGGDGRGRLFPHRGHRRAGRRRTAEDHGPEEGDPGHLGRQEHRPPAHRERALRRQVRRAGRGDRGPAELHLRHHLPSLPGPEAVGSPQAPQVQERGNPHRPGRRCKPRSSGRWGT